MRTKFNVDVPHDLHGNNVAFACPACGHPILATIGAPANMSRGQSDDRPSTCRRCMACFVVEGTRDDLELRRV